MTLWPKEMDGLIFKTFVNDRDNGYWQLATVSKTGIPAVRTVHIRFLEAPTPLIVFSTNTKSAKWKNLLANSNISGCFWNEKVKTQFRFQGKAALISDKNTKQRELLMDMWRKMRREVRLTYLLDDMNKSSTTKSDSIDPDMHSKHHGIVLIQPKTWDFFDFNAEKYTLSRRWIYQLKNGKWNKREVGSLHSE